MPTKSVASVQDLFPATNTPDGYLQTQAKILSSVQLPSQAIDKLNLSSRPELGFPSSRWSANEE
jgi:uncharacterized protein involved in exopolysaccharide biosynthesis